MYFSIQKFKLYNPDIIVTISLPDSIRTKYLRPISFSYRLNIIKYELEKFSCNLILVDLVIKAKIVKGLDILSIISLFRETTQ